MCHSYDCIKRISVASVAAAVLLAVARAMAQTPLPIPPAPALAPQVPPVYSVDLLTLAGMTALATHWRTMDAKIVEVPALPNAKPQWKTTYDLVPKAGEANFDDSSWPVIEPQALKEMRGGGGVSFIWYRIRLTIPSRIGDFDPSGTKVALSITVDDYAEVSINGQIPRAIGRPSPATIQGFNIPNRVLLSESAKPGDKFEIAILAINGPISIAPPNFVFFRQASLEFFKVSF